MLSTKSLLSKIVLLINFVILFPVLGQAKLKSFVKLKLLNRTKCDIYYDLSKDRKNLVFFSFDENTSNLHDLKNDGLDSASTDFGDVVSLNFMVPYENAEDYTINSVSFKKTKSKGIPDLSLVYGNSKEKKEVTAVIAHFTVFDRNRSSCKISPKVENFKDSSDDKKKQ